MMIVKRFIAENCHRLLLGITPIFNVWTEESYKTSAVRVKGFRAQNPFWAPLTATLLQE
jgi:hypothetical protein